MSTDSEYPNQISITYDELELLRTNDSFIEYHQAPNKRIRRYENGTEVVIGEMKGKQYKLLVDEHTVLYGKNNNQN